MSVSPSSSPSEASSTMNLPSIINNHSPSNSSSSILPPALSATLPNNIDHSSNDIHSNHSSAKSSDASSDETSPPSPIVDNYSTSSVITRQTANTGDSIDSPSFPHRYFPLEHGERASRLHAVSSIGEMISRVRIFLTLKARVGSTALVCRLLGIFQGTIKLYMAKLKELEEYGIDLEKAQNLTLKQVRKMIRENNEGKLKELRKSVQRMGLIWTMVMEEKREREKRKRERAAADKQAHSGGLDGEKGNKVNGGGSDSDNDDTEQGLAKRGRFETVPRDQLWKMFVDPDTERRLVLAANLSAPDDMIDHKTNHQTNNGTHLPTHPPSNIITNEPDMAFSTSPHSMVRQMFHAGWDRTVSPLPRANPPPPNPVPAAAPRTSPYPAYEQYPMLSQIAPAAYDYASTYALNNAAAQYVATLRNNQVPPMVAGVGAAANNVYPNPSLSPTLMNNGLAITGSVGSATRTIANGGAPPAASPLYPSWPNDYYANYASINNYPITPPITHSISPIMNDNRSINNNIHAINQNTSRSPALSRGALNNYPNNFHTNNGINNASPIIKQ